MLSSRSIRVPVPRPGIGLLTGAILLASPRSAHASMFQGETLDAIANVLSWVVLIVAPIVVIGVFWMVHILPEKIAHKRKHPQTKAIQCLCLLSLVFAGLLWPLAWLWAYSKPVFHKLAYGTDVDDSLDDHSTENRVVVPPGPASAPNAKVANDSEPAAS